MLDDNTMKHLKIYYKTTFREERRNDIRIVKNNQRQHYRPENVDSINEDSLATVFDNSVTHRHINCNQVSPCRFISNKLNNA